MGEAFPIVGLGASAGGLEAYEQFFRHLPGGSGMAFVVVQHLDPSHASILTEILQRSTTMPVLEAQDQMAVAPDHVYVIPPNRDMVIRQGVLQLSVPAEPRGQRLPIDTFLRSLAEDRGAVAVGIVLSGTGTDGTLGLGAILGAGGLSLVQDPATARYDGMPGSAIRAGGASQVLPVEQMPQVLYDSLRRLRDEETSAPSPATVRGLEHVLSALRSGTGHDFSQYKKNTIARRVERRMAAQGIEDIEVYARYVETNPTEVQALFHEMLINVTSFFRDDQAFAVLKTDILSPLLAAKRAGDPLRVWVAGCASGEEAYSIAMLLREALEESPRDLKIQLYATDLNDVAIATARAGLYPSSIAQDVSGARLHRFFVAEDTGYRVKKDIREMVVFAEQDLIKDPPFTRLDLLACRNVLIFLESELQNRLMPAFHYALKPGGVLFLSPSEGIGEHAELFEPIDRKWKFYRARPGAASTRTLLGSALSWTAGSGGHEPLPAGHAAKASQLAEITKRSLLQAYAPAAVVTDAQGNILYVHGETGKYLRPPPGRPSQQVVEMARAGLPMALREALAQASQGMPTLDRAVSVETDAGAQRIKLSVRPLPEVDGSPGALLVSFQEEAPTVPSKSTRRRGGKASGEALRIDTLERELVQAKEHSSALLEEQQASNEELKSANEELQSTNEELQSTNEELETAKEELQSVNEELVTVNLELQVKIEQMGRMQDDMKNLLDNLRLGTIFLDRHLLIRRFTRDATQVYRLVATDVGRALADIRCDLTGSDLITDAQAVLDSLVPVEREVYTSAGTWFLARIQPYRTTDNVIDGVVLTFADVTERVQAIAMRKARELAEAIVDTVHDPLIVLDGRLRMMTANRSYFREFGGSREEITGRPFFEAGQRQWDFAAMRELLETVLPGEGSFEDRAVEHDFADRGLRRLHCSARRIADQVGTGDLVLLTIALDRAGQP